MGLFPRPQRHQPSGGIFSRLEAARQMAGGNPQAAYEQLMRNNPKFAEFVRANQGKTPEQIASENGIDYSVVRRFMGM